MGIVFASNLLWVALGGAFGSVLRYVSIELVKMLHPQPFPLGTLLVNVIGSFAIGVLMARFMTQDSESTRLLLVTGLLGGFTTFSAFSWDALQLLQRGAYAQAALYVGGSVLLSVAAVAMGYKIA